MIGLLIYLKMWVIRFRYFRKLERDAKRPRETQESLLLEILKRNAATDFGIKFNLSAIRSYTDYQRIVPVHTYEELRPYIEKQISGHFASLTATPPVMYAQTSGTTGKAKYIPILEESIVAYKRAQKIASYAEYRDVPGIFSGKILAVVSPAIEGYLENGMPYGSMSGIVYKNMPDIVRSQYVLPSEIFECVDYEIKYQLIAAFALAEENITVLASANPSTFLRLEEIIQQHTDKLIHFVATGDLMSLVDGSIDKEVVVKLLPYCRVNARRAEHLKRILSKHGALKFHDLWPNIKAVVTWTSGSCGLLIPKLKRLLPTEVAIIEMGYLSSEFRGTITLDCIRNLGLPAIQDVFFEFIEITDWSKDIHTTLTIEQIEAGKRYYILVTALHGLYRYFINDIIEVTGKYENTPTISFVQKGKGVTSFSGEKLYESQVIQAVQQTCLAFAVEPDFFIMLADEADFSYVLYLESKTSLLPVTFTALLNQTIGELNMEYLAKIQSGRIKSATVNRLKSGALEAFKKHCISAGQREGQFKIVKLQYRKDVSFSFDEYVEV
ncbi:GH3 auxin-responsive promoter family protein [Sulfurirhabdus autotrophica]|uniref:GH3 auxin-responsive promoter n=1 Tax=Sulfurirhabdus autotrophica TaxID=1706046 RepID=A0A4R3Y2K2_9PROT|nr:GH3 auxin-responsive promoter family protein [Sulfurirhabdus autotrophica]TCV85920.1 GH3 auxin-responsive promoter [Sulfurirhabdus autotrophica]